MKKGQKKQKPFSTDLSDVELLRAILPQDEQEVLKKGKTITFTKFSKEIQPIKKKKM